MSLEVVALCYNPLYRLSRAKVKTITKQEILITENLLLSRGPSSRRRDLSWANLVENFGPGWSPPPHFSQILYCKNVKQIALQNHGFADDPRPPSDNIHEYVNFAVQLTPSRS